MYYFIHSCKNDVHAKKEFTTTLYSSLSLISCFDPLYFHLTYWSLPYLEFSGRQPPTIVVSFNDLSPVIWSPLVLSPLVIHHRKLSSPQKYLAPLAQPYRKRKSSSSSVKTPNASLLDFWTLEKPFLKYVFAEVPLLLSKDCQVHIYSARSTDHV